MSDVYGEDVGREQVRRAVLEHLSKHGDDMWREIARGLLDGAVTPRDVATSTVYREQLIDGTHALLKRRDDIGETAFEELGHQADRVVNRNDGDRN